MSGVGKGIATSAIGQILQAKGLDVHLIKVDSYLNVDAGTMNPTEHGETFVLRSGLECDQDMGTYERFLNKSLNEEEYITSETLTSEISTEFDPGEFEQTFEFESGSARIGIERVNK